MPHGAGTTAQERESAAAARVGYHRRTMRGFLCVMLLGGCHAVFGDFTVEEAPPEAEDECTVDADCDESVNEGCDSGRCAIRCLEDGQCPAFSECWAADYCSEPIGTACDPDEVSPCGGYSCQDRDAEARPADGYCTGHCSLPNSPCPSGFVCLDLRCFLAGP